MKNSGISKAPGKPKFQGGTNKGTKLSGKVGVVTPPPKNTGTPKDKGVNR